MGIGHPEVRALPPKRRGGGLRRRVPVHEEPVPRRPAKFAKICEHLAISFSAVSAPTFARKYAFGSSFENLQDHLTEL